MKTETLLAFNREKLYPDTDTEVAAADITMAAALFEEASIAASRYAYWDHRIAQEALVGNLPASGVELGKAVYRAVLEGFN